MIFPQTHTNTHTNKHTHGHRELTLSSDSVRCDATLCTALAASAGEDRREMSNVNPREVDEDHDTAEERKLGSLASVVFNLMDRHHDHHISKAQ